MLQGNILHLDAGQLAVLTYVPVGAARLNIFSSFMKYLRRPRRTAHVYHVMIAEVKQLHNGSLGWADKGAQAAFVAGFRVQAHCRLNLAEPDHPVNQVYLDIDRTDPSTSAAVDAWSNGVERRGFSGDQVYAVIVGNRCLVRELPSGKRTVTA